MDAAHVRAGYLYLTLTIRARRGVQHHLAVLQAVVHSFKRKEMLARAQHSAHISKSVKLPGVFQARPRPPHTPRSRPRPRLRCRTLCLC